MKKFKYFVLFLGLLILTSVFIYAEEWNDGSDNKEVSETNLSETNESVQEVTIAGTERTEENHYGVNKKWNITDNNMSNVMSVPYVDASLKIYDYSNIITPEEEQILLPMIQSYIDRTNMDMVILTYNLPYSIDEQNETFATDFYDYNDFGIDFKYYSGVLLFRNTYEEDPYYDVYMFGEAQLYYDYERANDMLDNIYPSMIGHNYLTAFKIFIEDYTKYFNKGIALKNYDLDENGFLQKKYVPPIFISLLAGGIVSFIIVSIMVKKNKMIKKANDATEYADKSALKYNVKQDILTGSITTSHRISSDSGGSSGGGGFHSSSGSSGGGHTSGGGRHG